jgi:hypothetical protein
LAQIIINNKNLFSAHINNPPSKFNAGIDIFT